MEHGRSQLTRRESLKLLGLVSGAAAMPQSSFAESNRRADGFPLTIAGYAYDRVAALDDGTVGVEGCEVRYETDKIGALNTHLFSGPGTREVSEVGLHPFMLAYANDNFRDYALLPIFPLRTFRHKSIFIRTDRGITKPEDLKGRKVGTPGFSSTSLTWLRGILQQEYGLRQSDVEWVVSANDSSADTSGGASKFENIIPDGLRVTTGPVGKDESQLLVDGDVDALFHALEPKAFVEGNPLVTRLFSDFRQTEQDYFRKTGIFPIMHAVAIRKDFAMEHPEVPLAVCRAYSEAKQRALVALQKLGWANISLPWIAKEIEDTREVMGDDFWPYGIAPNRKALDTLFQYSHEQGLASRKLEIEELFHRSTLGFEEKIR